MQIFHQIMVTLPADVIRKLDERAAKSGDDRSVVISGMIQRTIIDEEVKAYFDAEAEVLASKQWLDGRGN
jgi:metal-responsive CopG/Arc/MetJ family transcriptional regulator